MLSPSYKLTFPPPRCCSNAKPAPAELDPLDRDGRAAAIAATFDAAHIPLSELRHPTKRGVTAVESFDLLPDDDLWANEYDLVRFGEDPSSIATVRPSFPPAAPTSTSSAPRTVLT